MAGRGERVALAALVTESSLAGVNVVAVRFSNRELDPLWGAGLRFALSAALFFLIMAVVKVPFPRGRALTGAALYGLFNFGGAFGLAYYGLVEVQGGVGSTVLALAPLATLLLAAAQGQERIRFAGIAGSLLALVGVALISRAPLRGSVPFLSLLALAGGVVCFAQGAVLGRRLPAMHPAAMNAVGMSAGAAVLLVLSALAGDSFVLPDHVSTWLGVGYLVTVGSVGVFWLFLVVLKYWDASRAAFGFVLSPVVAVLLSALVDDEPITSGLILGGILVLAGVYIGALRPVLRSPATESV